jgi:hypothetical protein
MNPQAQFPRPRPGTLIVLLCVLSHVSFAQGTFQNLGFEAADPRPVPGGPAGHVQFVPAFPGWTCTVNGRQQSSALFNNLNATPALALYGPGFDPLDGSYSALFQASTLFLPSEVSLFQSGLVPDDALSLRFLATSPAALGDGSLSVSLNGTLLNYSVLQDFGAYSLYAGDVSSFAGQLAELRFSDTVAPGGMSTLMLDAVNFSPVAVPEPSAWALLVCGTAAGWAMLRRGRSKS